MMRVKKFFMPLLSIVLSMSLCFGAFAASAPSEYIEGQAAPSSSSKGIKNAEDQYDKLNTTTAQSKGFVLEEFQNSQIAQDMTSALYNYYYYDTEDQANPAITNYWAAKGVTKEYYDLYDPDHQWAVYYPNGTYFEADEDYLYPVVFCLHGGNNSILMAESYGWAELAGKERASSR